MAESEAEAARSLSLALAGVVGCLVDALKQANALDLKLLEANLRALEKMNRQSGENSVADAVQRIGPLLVSPEPMLDFSKQAPSLRLVPKPEGRSEPPSGD